MLKAFVKVVINFFISLILFPHNFLIFLINLKKIIHQGNIVIQTIGGFGHTFVMPDLSRHCFKKDFLYIWFIEESRHNIYIKKIFDVDYLIFKNNISIKLNGKTITLGEKEDTSFKVFEKFFIFLIKKINKKNVLIDFELYRFVEKKYPNRINNKFPKNDLYVGVYYYLKKNNTNNLNFSSLKSNFPKNQKMRNIFNLEKNMNNNVCIYLRNRMIEDQSITNRNGSEAKEYFEMLNFFFRKKL